MSKWRPAWAREQAEPPWKHWVSRAAMLALGIVTAIVALWLFRAYQASAEGVTQGKGHPEYAARFMTAFVLCATVSLMLFIGGLLPHAWARRLLERIGPPLDRN